MNKHFIKSTIAAATLALGFGLAQPAGAVMIGYTISGNDLNIIASDLGSDFISAWDIEVFFDAGLTPVSWDADPGNFLGYSDGLADAIAWDLGGEIDAFLLSYLSDAQLATRQAGQTSLVLATFRFFEDITGQQFTFVWDEFNDVKCGNNTVCYPVPEPGTLALFSLGLLGLGFGRRRLASRPAA